MEKRISEADFNYIEIEDPNILFAEVKKYVTDSESIERVKDAYYYAAKKHHGQKRKSKADFIVHPLTCAYYLAQWRMNVETVIAGLLHDVIEDTPVSKSEIEDIFGPTVANMVESLSKSEYLTKNNKQKFKNQYLEKLIFNLIKDVNVIFVKLADRMSNVLTLEFMKPEKQIAIAQETIDVYVSIASRIGMKKAKENLEDLCFKIINPRAYEEIETEINKNKDEREKLVKTISHDLLKALDLSSIFNTKVYGRNKTRYSIYKKTKNGKGLLSLGDILAFRIITNSIEDCYLALGIVHKIYTPLSGRFKDYIAVPKNNMYQSLHTTVISKEGFVFEVQIRTYEMDLIAESGAAAHWQYKKGEENLSDQEKQKNIREKASYLNEVLNLSGELNEYASEFKNELIDQNVKENLEEIIKTDFLTPMIYVLAKDGRVFNLVIGSTILDFSYMIDPVKAPKTVGALVNGMEMSYNTSLENGDIIEVQYSENQFPDKEWLMYVKTVDAKKAIKKYLDENKGKSKNKKTNKQLIVEGSNKINQYIVDNNLKWEINPKDIEKNLKLINFKNKEEFFLAVGKNEINIADAIKYVYMSKLDKSMIDEAVKALKISKFSIGQGRNDINIGKKMNISCVLADCCMPLPIDEIIYLTNDSDDTLEIHRKICPKIISIPKEELSQIIGKADWIKSNVKNNYYRTKYIFKLNNYEEEQANSIVEIIRDYNEIFLSSVTSIIHDDEYSELIKKIVCEFKIKGEDSILAIENEFKKIKGLITTIRVMEV